jgi:hypothetical protein
LDVLPQFKTDLTNALTALPQSSVDLSIHQTAVDDAVTALGLGGSPSIPGENGLTDSITTINSIISTLDTVYNQAETAIFTLLSDMRLFWVEARVGKPTGSLIAVNGLGTASNSKTTEINQAENALNSLFPGNRDRWLPKPKIFASFYNPSIYDAFNAPTPEQVGDVEQNAIEIVWDGLKNASDYQVHRRLFSAVDWLTFSNDDQWTGPISTYTDQNDDGTIKTSFKDTGIVSGEVYVYRIRTTDTPNNYGSDQSDILNELGSGNIGDLTVEGTDYKTIDISPEGVSRGAVLLLRGSTETSLMQIVKVTDTQLILSGGPYTEATGTIYTISGLAVSSF